MIDTVYITIIKGDMVCYAQFGLTIDQANREAKSGELLIYDNCGIPTWVIFDYRAFPDTDYLLSELIAIADKAAFFGSKKANFRKYMG